MSRHSSYAEILTKPRSETLLEKIDTMVCSFHSIINTLKSSVEETRQEKQIYNPVVFESRLDMISTMHHIRRELQKLVSIVEKNGNAAESLHKSEIKNTQNILNYVKKDLLKQTVIPLHLETEIPNFYSVKISGDICVDAIILPMTLKTVPEIFKAINSNNLYFIPQWNHFAVRIGDCVLHANIGNIYTNGNTETLKRIKECKRTNCTGCSYYHDPELFIGSTDVRNFMDTSWHYTSIIPSCYGIRRIGSINHIETDIHMLNLSDARKFIHQTSHDIICSIILWKYIASPKAQQLKKTVSIVV